MDPCQEVHHHGEGPSSSGIGFLGAAGARARRDQRPFHAVGECCLGATISTGQLAPMDLLAEVRPRGWHWHKGMVTLVKQAFPCVHR